MSRYFLCWLLFIQLSLAASAQHRIYGKVASEQTGVEIEGVHVFLDGSTQGALTDQSGVYELKDIWANNFQLVFSFVGYQPYAMEIRNLSQDTVINVFLKEGVYELEDVSVQAIRQKKWDRYMKRFRRAFLGENFNEVLVSIENEYILEFKDERGDSFSVESQPILKVRNEYLGYDLYFQVETFRQREGTSSLGYAAFREMESAGTDQSSIWVENRSTAYLGSPRHFFKALIDGNWEEEGFAATNLSHRLAIGMSHRYEEVRKDINVGEVLGSGVNISVKKREDGIYEIEFQGVLEIFYFDESNSKDFQKTEISMSSPLEVFPNGVIRNPKAMISYGFWSKQGVYEMLPFEYLPEK